MGGEGAAVTTLQRPLVVVDEEATMASADVETNNKLEEEYESTSLRQVAELAAAAAHRKSLDEDEVLGGGSSGAPPPPANTTPGGSVRTPRGSLSRHRSSGGPRRTSSSGLRAMSRSLGAAADPQRGMIGRTSSMHTPRSRGVHRSVSNDMSPMLSRSFARSGSSHRASGPVEPERGVRRSQSSITGSRARLAPDHRSLKRTDSARGEPSRRGVGRTCSQNSLNHMSQNGMQPGQAEVGTLRPYRGREGLVNVSIQRTDSGVGGGAGPSGSLRRQQQLNMLRASVDDRSVGELSSFTMATMDSVNLRKQQIVADPIDDAASTYREADSVADHDSVSMATNDYATGYTEFLPKQDPNHVAYDGVSVADNDTIASGMDELSHSQYEGGGGGGHRGSGHYHYHHQHSGGARLLDDTRLLENDTNHSRPNQIACDAVSLSTMGGEIEEEDSYFGDGVEDGEYEATLREEIEAFDEIDDVDEDEGGAGGYILEGVKEREDEEEESAV